MSAVAVVLTAWAFLLVGLLTVGFVLDLRARRASAAARAELRAALAAHWDAPICADLASQPRYLPLTWRWVPGPDPLGDERLAEVVAEWGVDS